MQETELDRLVVRLTGDNSSYTRMLSDTETQNKVLTTSLRQVEDAHKKLEEKVKQSSVSWKANSSAIRDTSSAMEKLNSVTRDSTSLFDRYVSSVKAGLAEIRSELTKTGVAYLDTLSGGYFDQNRTSLQQGIARLNPSTYVSAVQGWAAGYRANLPTVVRDSSTYSMDKSGRVTINPSTYRLTESAAENEDYQKSLKPFYEGMRRDDAARQRSLRMEDISHISNRGTKVQELKKVLSDAIRDETLLINESKEGGGGLLDEINTLERNSNARGTAGYMSKLLGVKNPYEEDIAKKRVLLAKRREEALEATRRRVGATRNIEDAERSYRFGDEATIREMRMDNATFNMSPNEARLHRMKESGASFSAITGVRGEMWENRYNLQNKALQDDERERSEIGMKPRAIRDKRLSEDMKKAGYSESQIAAQIGSNKQTDSAKDKQELIDTTKAYIKALDSESAALKNSRDAMQPYYDLVKKLDKQIKDETDPVKRQELTDKRTGLGASVREHEKAGIQQRYGMSRADQFSAEKKKLDDMRNDKTNPIDSDTYNRALVDLQQTYQTNNGSGLQPASMGIHSTSDPGEAYSRLMAFREDAFAAKGDTRGGPIAKVRKAKARQTALRRRKGVTVDELGDPTAGMDFDFPGDDKYSDPLTDLGVRPEEAESRPIESASGMNKEVQKPTHDYWANTSTGTIDDPVKILERIAKAVEKEAETKVETADLK